MSMQNFRPYRFDRSTVCEDQAGVFATRDIHQGEEIIAEKPLFSLQVPAGKQAPAAQIFSEFDRLQPRDKERFLELTHISSAQMIDIYGTESHAPLGLETLAGQVVAIYENNCFSDGLNTNLVTIECSRLNHSCVPNAIHVWRGDKGHLSVRAIVDIKKHHEIFISYLPQVLPRSIRIDNLKRFGFECTCEACVTGTEYSDQTEMRRLNHLLPLNQRLQPAEEALGLDERFDRSRSFEVQIEDCQQYLKHRWMEPTMKVEQATA